MDDSDRLKACQAAAEISRKWVSVMDAKAAFVSAMNGAILAFVWSSAKLMDAAPSRNAAITATVCCMLSLFAAVWIVLPRGIVPGWARSAAANVPQFTFYGYAASFNDGARFADSVKTLTELDLIEEALFQHWIISRIVKTKEVTMVFSGRMLFCGLASVFVAFLLKICI